MGHDPAHRSLIDELNEDVSSGGEEHRQRILERITDLFAAGSRGYSGDQIALFDDVLQELIAEIEVKARARLAQRLAHIGNAPTSSSARSPSTTKSAWPSRCSSIRNN